MAQKGQKYRIHPNKAQEKTLNEHFGCARYVYNWALDAKITAYRDSGETLTYSGLSKMLTLSKKEEGKGWLKEVASQSLQQSIMDVFKAYNNFFRGAKGGKNVGYPKFKAKHRCRDSYRVPQGFKIDFRVHKVFLPKIGWVHFGKNDNRVRGNINSITVYKDKTNCYYISVQYDDGLPLPPKAKVEEGTSVGVDLGLIDTIAQSDGKKVTNPKFGRAAFDRIEKLQRDLAGKQRGSNRYEKQRLKLAKCHKGVANQRKNFLHHLSKRLVERYDTISFETLNIKGMMQNHCLAGAIADASWGELMRQVTYKAEWAGKNVLHIPTFQRSTKKCSWCGNEDVELKLHHRKWVCPLCGAKHDRDINAAKNIDAIARGKLAKDKGTVVNGTPPA